LEANFLKVSPAYLTATSKLGVNGSYGAPASIAVTPLVGNGTRTNFYVVRHANFSSLDKTQYSLTVYTSVGNVSIPQLGSNLTLNGRDSKFHVTDYDLDGINLIYSTAEIFTWARGLGSSRVLVLYGGAGETHEFALSRHLGNPAIIEGDNVSFHPKDLMWVVRWQVGLDRSVIRLSNLEIYLVWRNEAYNYWALELPASHPIGNFSSPSKDRVIVKAGYLVRSAKLVNKQLWLSGDVNTTTNIEVISTPVGRLQGLVFNGQQMKTSRTTTTGKLSTIIEYQPPTLDIPDLTNLRWKYRDSLPEIKSSYDDSAWQSCDKLLTHNPRNLDTPTVLYAMDYGFHTGSLLYRGHFSANGHESYIWLNTSGGIGFGHSVWLDDTFLGSWPGTGANATITQNFTIPTALSSGTQHILSVLIDNMGQDEEAPGTDAIKFPHGILGYQLSNHAQSDVSWKVTGNLGGEQYRDLARGPLNEGAMYAERQGYHYPSPPDSEWELSSPFKTGLLKAGVGFYTTSFRLNIPDGWDVPFSIVFNNSTAGDPSQKTSGLNYRCQLYVNGYQYGKYSKSSSITSHIHPTYCSL
jgi:beta-galactosidase